MYKHIVLFKIRDEVEDSMFQKALSALIALGKDDTDIKQWVINPSIDSRKGRIIVEDALFDNEETFQAFRTSQKHADVAAIMREISDWWVGDYLTD